MTITDGRLPAPPATGSHRVPVAAAFAEHRRDLTAAARRSGFGGDDAEDVVQEVFATLWARPERFDPSRGELAAYLRLATRSRAVDAGRAERSRRARQDRFAHREANRDATAADELAMDRLVQARARDHLGRLPDRERQAITLAFFGGFPYKEVARRTGLPEGTVKARIRSGLARLRAELVADGFGGGDTT